MKKPRRSLITMILALFIAFNICSIMFFSYYIIQQDNNRTSHNINETLTEIVNEKAEIISLSIARIESETANLAIWAEEYLSSDYIPDIAGDYYLNEEGVLHRKKKKNISNEEFKYNNSSVHLQAGKELDENMLDSIAKTERLDEQFSNMRKNIPYIGWIAMLTESGLLRVYPYDKMEMYDKDHEHKDEPFYKTAVENNEDGQVRWSEPYLDMMGTGWVITCTRPVYAGAELVGIISVDLNLSTIEEEFLSDFRVGESGFLFLIDNEGLAIYHPSYEPKGDNRGEFFHSNILKDKDTDEEYKKALTKITDNRHGVDEYKSRTKDITIAYASIEGQPWKLGVEVDKEEFTVTNKLNVSSLIALISISVLMLVIFSFLLIRHYSRPLKSLAKRAELISEGDFSIQDNNYQYWEMSELADVFNAMSSNIKSYTDMMVHKNKEIESIFNSIGDTIMIIDSDFNIVNINGTTDKDKCYEELFGKDHSCTGCKVRQVFENMIPDKTQISINSKIYEISYYPVISEDFSNEAVVYRKDVTEDLLLQREVFQKEKMAGIGQLSSSIAHELKTPLSVIKGATWLLRNDLQKKNDIDKPAIREQLDVINETTEDAEKIIHNLLDYTAISKIEETDIDMERLLDQLIFMSRKESSRINVKIKMNFSESPFIFFGKLEPLKQIILNLFTNAFTAIDGGGDIIINCEKNHIDEKKYMKLEVRDNGSGIDPEIKDKLFEPFVTTSQEGNSIGLGLWITKRIVETIDGTISVKGTTDGWTSAVIILPEADRKLS